MAGLWTDVLPLAVAAGVLTALVRTAELRARSPGWAIGQRLGLVLTTVPLYILVLVGLTSLPRLLGPEAGFALPTEALANKAALHLMLYLAVPLVGLVLVIGPRRLLASLPDHLVGGRPLTERLSRGLATTFLVSSTLVGAVVLGWPAISSSAGLFSAEGPRVFFSNTTPLVALLLASVAAIAEEMLFRGVLQGQLRRRIGLHTAVVLQAVLFGLIHAGYGSMLHVLAAAIFGLFMGYLVARHGLLPAMLTHFTVNVAVLAAWSEEPALLATTGIVLALLAGAAWLLHTMHGPSQQTGEAGAPAA